MSKLFLCFLKWSVEVAKHCVMDSMKLINAGISVRLTLTRARTNTVYHAVWERSWLIAYRSISEEFYVWAWIKAIPEIFEAYMSPHDFYACFARHRRAFHSALSWVSYSNWEIWFCATTVFGYVFSCFQKSLLGKETRTDDIRRGALSMSPGCA